MELSIDYQGIDLSGLVKLAKDIRQGAKGSADVPIRYSLQAEGLGSVQADH